MVLPLADTGREMIESIGMAVVTALVVMSGGRRDHSVRGGPTEDGDPRDVVQ